MTDRAQHMHEHIDHIEARLDLIGAMFAGNRVSDRWPMPREEYEAVAKRLDDLAAIARQHIEKYDRRDQWDEEFKARAAA